jgi:predicted transcriptional regulator
MRMAVRIATNLTLPPELVAEVDALAGRRNRSRFVEEAVRARLRRERLGTAIEKAAGAWAGRGPTEWGEPDGVVAWVRAQRVMETDPGPPER